MKTLIIKEGIFWKADFKFLSKDDILYIKSGKLIMGVSKNGRKQNKQTAKRHKKQSHK